MKIRKTIENEENDRIIRISVKIVENANNQENENHRK